MLNKAILYVLVAVVWLAGCAPKPEFSYVEPPGHSGGSDDEEERKGIVSIAWLKTLYDRTPRPITEDISIQGVIVANDWCANFFRTIVVEDTSGGIKVKVDERTVLTKHTLGTTVTIYCNGLSLGSYGGMLQLGWASADPQYETTFIPEERIADHVVILDDVPEVPLTAPVRAISELEERHVNTLVAFDAVQFAAEEAGKKYTENGADTDRWLVDAAGNRLAVRTSARATFSTYGLPAGSGRIEGVLGYFNGNFQLRIVSDLRVMMDKPRF